MSAPSSSSPQDWMVLQCQACGARMKSRRTVARDASLLCPECRMPVAIPLPEGEILPPEAEPAPEFAPQSLPPTPAFGRGAPAGATGGGTALPGYRDGEVFDGGNLPARSFSRPGAHPVRGQAAHPVFDGSTVQPGHEDLAADDDAEFTEASDEDSEGNLPSEPARPRGDRRVRIKKRRRKNENTYVELTDWDQKDLSRIPEAEVEADTWRKSVPMPEDMFIPEVGDFVVQTEGGQAARKKVRRKAKGSRYFFLQFTRASTFFVVGLGVLLAGVGVYGITQLKKDYVPPAFQATVEEEKLDRRVLTQSDVEGAEKAVRGFLSADGVEAKLAFVRQPSRVRPLMEKWYQSHSAAPITAGEVAMQQKTGGEIDSPGYFVMLAMPLLVPDPLNPGQTLDEMTFFSVQENRKDGVSSYLLDWETSTGFQEMPLEAFKSTMPKEAHTFRVSLKPGDYYNHGFAEKEWQCFNLTYPGRDFQIWAYLRRNSPDGRIMQLKLENGWTGNMVIAELQYPEKAASRDQVTLTRIVQHSWYLPDVDEPKGTPEETAGESGK